MFIMSDYVTIMSHYIIDYDYDYVSLTTNYVNYYDQLCQLLCPIMSNYFNHYVSLLFQGHYFACQCLTRIELQVTST